MKLRKKQQGQGMVELLLLTSLLGVTFWLSVSQLNHALNEQHEQLDSIRADMFQPVPQPTWQRHPGDQFSQQVGRVLRPMQQYTQLNVALDNLYSVGSDHHQYSLARLVDGWQAQHAGDLIKLPQALTLSHYVEQLGLGHVLNFVGYLPIAKELTKEQLQLGKVAPDVTPFELRCRAEPCRQ